MFGRENLKPFFFMSYLSESINYQIELNWNSEISVLENWHLDSSPTFLYF